MGTDAFVQRVLSHLPSLLRAGRVLTGRTADAEDLAQETLLRAVQRRDTLEDPERLKAWLLSIQRNVYFNGVRGLRTRFEVLEGGAASGSKHRRAEPAAAASEPDAEAVGDEVAAALASLQPEWREALWLREVEELSYEEIAQAQRCPVGTVRSRLARARAALLDILQNDKGMVRHGRV